MFNAISFIFKSYTLINIIISKLLSLSYGEIAKALKDKAKDQNIRATKADDFSYYAIG